MDDPTMQPAPAPFTAADFSARLQRAARSADAAGLSGLLLTPGPDLLYLSGYAPVAITERITMLVVPVGDEPTIIVPRLERPDAEESPGA
jgi:Xaa-Pro aminopeptidase